METTILSSKGQVVIPKRVRELARAAAGDAFVVRYHDGEIHLRPVTRVTGTPERADAVREALRNCESGLGFADALNLALSAGAEQFLTFDKAFARQAKKITLKPDALLA